MELVWEEDGEEHSVGIGPDRPTVLLGRVSECDIRVSRTSVSRRHALFTWANGSVIVTDQGSTAGTYIDGRKITKERVAVGAVVNCGGIMVLLDQASKGARGSAKASKDLGSWADESTFGGGASMDRVGNKKDIDLDALFDKPFTSTRRGGGAAADKGSRGGSRDQGKRGDDFDSFFGSQDDGFDDFEPPASSSRDQRRVAEEPPPPAPIASSTRAHLACYLLYIDDDGQNAEVRVERDRDPVLIGRREGATLKVHNPSVSGKHCTVGWKDEEVEVRDLGSSNGTFINGERTRRGVLNDGDVLRCGRFELRVSFVEHKQLAQAEYEEWGDDWSDDELDPGQPNYYIVFRDNRNQLTGVVMGERDKRLAVGSKGCEINIEGRSVEGEHCELEWDEGVLLVKDLRSETGTFVNDEAVEGDETLRNGDVIVVGRARLRVVRGTSDEMGPPRPEKRSEEGDLWARHLENRDDDLELLFIDGEVDDDGGRHELSIWGNGECRIETITAYDRHVATGMLDRDLRKILFDGILKAGFPDVKTKQTRSGEVPAELNLFQNRDEAKVVLSKKLTQRSPAYHEVLEVLRSVALEMSAR